MARARSRWIIFWRGASFAPDDAPRDGLDVPRAFPPVANKLNGDWEFLTHLRDIGRECAEVWLKTNFARLGRESTVDIRAKYL